MPSAIQKVYLKHIVNGEEVLLDSAIVKNRRFHFEALLLNLRRLP